MKTLVAIPSKGRAQLFGRRTFKWLQFYRETDTKGLVEWKVFVEPQDFDIYSKLYGEKRVVKLPENNQGLGYAKECIQKYALDNGFDAIFKMDDDIARLRHCQHRSTKKLYDTFDPGEDSLENSKLIMVEACVQFERMIQKNPSTVAMSFPYAKEMWRLEPFTNNKRTQTAYLCLTKWFCPPAGRQVSVFEDFYVYLWYRMNNKEVVRYNLLGIECDDIGTNAGGHQSDDRKKRALAEAEILRKMHPALKFRRVQKPWAIEPDLRSIP